MKEVLLANRYSNENFVAQDNVTPSYEQHFSCDHEHFRTEISEVETASRNWFPMRDSRHARLVHVIELSNANAITRYCISCLLRRCLEYIPNVTLVNVSNYKNSNHVN